MLATTKSTRTSIERELINWHSGEDLGVFPYARATAEIVTGDLPRSIAIGIETPPQGRSRLRKSIVVDGHRRRATSAIGTLNCVLFEPVDIELVAGSPSQRRRFLDMMLSQIDPGYLAALSRYQRIIEQRNSLLKSLQRDGGAEARASASQLDFWNTELIAHGSSIVGTRLRAVDQLRELSRERMSSFMGSVEFDVTYQFSTAVSTILDTTIHSQELSALSNNELAFQMASWLEQVGAQELRRGVTLVGPHRDDLAIELNGVSVSSFGSRGQQRLSAVALKLSEAELMARKTGERPVILLDDILSELDLNHRQMLTESIMSMGSQLVVTSTDIETLKGAGLTLSASASISEGAFSWN